jgi:hypothetical protein
MDCFCHLQKQAGLSGTNGLKAHQARVRSENDPDQCSASAATKIWGLSCRHMLCAGLFHYSLFKVGAKNSPPVEGRPKVGVVLWWAEEGNFPPHPEGKNHPDLRPPLHRRGIFRRATYDVGEGNYFFRSPTYVVGEGNYFFRRGAYDVGETNYFFRRGAYVVGEGNYFFRRGAYVVGGAIYFFPRYCNARSIVFLICIFFVLYSVCFHG